MKSINFKAKAILTTAALLTLAPAVKASHWHESFISDFSTKAHMLLNHIVTEKIHNNPAQRTPEEEQILQAIQEKEWCQEAFDTAKELKIRIEKASLGNNQESLPNLGYIEYAMERCNKAIAWTAGTEQLRLQNLTAIGALEENVMSYEESVTKSVAIWMGIQRCRRDKENEDLLAKAEAVNRARIDLRNKRNMYLNAAMAADSRSPYYKPDFFDIWYRNGFPDTSKFANTSSYTPTSVMPSDYNYGDKVDAARALLADAIKEKEKFFSMDFDGIADFTK